jgi:lantibiotic modifying enzyme
LKGIEKRGWISGTPRGLESPGLLTGISGIGYQCLRLARPNLVPSVLMLAAPV